MPPPRKPSVGTSVGTSVARGELASTETLSFRCKSERCRRTRGVAFTLAEVLITLGIIGVVAAMTMPTVIAKHQKQVTVQRLKKAYSVLSQMVIQTYADNGPVSDYLGTGETVNTAKTKEFFETYWLPYFNSPIVKDKFYTKGQPYSTIGGEPLDIGVVTDYGAGRILFSTQDGTIYFVRVMSWSKDDNENDIAIFSNNQQVFVDINGTKTPNRLGRDVFMFNVNFDNNIVRPNCWGTPTVYTNCKKGVNGGTCCAARIMEAGWQIKDDYPW